MEYIVYNMVINIKFIYTQIVIYVYDIIFIQRFPTHVHIEGNMCRMFLTKYQK